MVTGVSSGAWGYSPQMVAGMNSPMEMNGKPLTYDLNLTSVPVNFNGDTYISPLTTINKGFYSKNPSEFGKKSAKKSLTKRVKISLTKINKLIKSLKE
jgi:hypothetical protein